jgi:membrane protein involved in colicin uptake
MSKIKEFGERNVSYKTNYNKHYYEKNKQKLLEYNRENQKKKYANENERVKILERNRKRYDERKQIIEKMKLSYLNI